MNSNNNIAYAIDEEWFFQIGFLDDCYIKPQPDIYSLDWYRKIPDWNDMMDHYLSYMETVEELLDPDDENYDPNFVEDVSALSMDVHLIFSREFEGTLVSEFMSAELIIISIQGLSYWGFKDNESVIDEFPACLDKEEAQIILIKTLLNKHSDRLRLINNKDFMVIKQYFDNL